MQLVQTNALLHAGEVHRIACARVIGKLRFRFSAIGELDFVDHDPRMKLVSLCNYKKTIEHSQMRLGLHDSKHDYDLIDVRCDDSLTPPFAGHSSRKLRSARQNFLD